jgi:hypothetical protein
MAKNKNRRPQAMKVGNREMAKAMQEFRRSNATVPIPSGTKYKRAKAGARGRDW